MTVGDPLAGALMGPLHREIQVQQYLDGVAKVIMLSRCSSPLFNGVYVKAVAAGGKLLFGGKAVKHELGGFFVQPALIAMPNHGEMRGLGNCGAAKMFFSHQLL